MKLFFYLLAVGLVALAFINHILVIQIEMGVMAAICLFIGHYYHLMDPDRRENNE